MLRLVYYFTLSWELISKDIADRLFTTGNTAIQQNASLFLHFFYILVGVPQHCLFCVPVVEDMRHHYPSLWESLDICLHPHSICFHPAEMRHPHPSRCSCLIWKNHPNITSVTPLFNGLYVPTKVGRTLLVLGSSFCQVHLLPPPATRMGTSGRNPGSLGENLVALTTGPQLLILSNVKNGSEAHKGKYNRY